jgi:probable HAF family extracellular repeat protein
MNGLGYLSGGTTSTAMGTSADGSVVVGFSSTTGASYEAFRWTSGGGMVGLGELPGNVTSFRSAARAVSADGAVITGEAATTNYQAYRWTAATGLVSLGTLPGGAVYSVGQALSTDGNVIVGYADSPQGTQAFRWTSATGMLPLGDLPGGAFMSQAYGVSGDGSIVVGFGETASGDTAFIWDALHGIRDLKTALVTDFGLDLTGWTLNSAMGISEDGRVITGAGTDPAGQTEAFAVFVPEPSTFGTLIAAGAILIRRRERSR